ncbi:hypothetical protein [Virgibacillus siamensis]|uniref:hypothetical protein n=1 Tax=Virgibacillus siamensis TaxID=480071 RepID=UPI00098737E7|nr:hypothetical protein [Virgibacillus siamensis]
MLGMEIKRIVTRPVLYVLLFTGFILALMPVIVSWPGNVSDDYYILYPRNPFISWMFFGAATYNIYVLIFPLLAALPYSDAYAQDYNSGLVKSILTKVNKRKYLNIRFIVNFIVGGVVAIFPPVVNFLLQMTAFPVIENSMYYGMNSVGTQSFMPELFYHQPFLYILVRVIMLFLLGGLLASLGLALSTAVKNRYIILVFPFLVFMGLDVLFVSTGFVNYSISMMYLFDVPFHWGFPLYLLIGTIGSYVWYKIAGEKNETM